MKKLLALLLSLVMVLSLVPNVWGTDEDDVFTQLRKAGYDAPTEDQMTLCFPDGLVRGVDYDYTYVYEETCKDTVLTIVVKKGAAENWEQAYRNLKRGDGTLNAEIFMPKPDTNNVVRVSRPLNGNKTDGRVLDFISGDISVKNTAGEEVGYFDFVPMMPGIDEPIAAYNVSNGAVTITPEKSSTDMYYAMLYDVDQDEKNGNEIKWMIHYRVIREEDFAHEFDADASHPVDADRIVIDSIDRDVWMVSQSDGLVTIQAKDPAITSKREVGRYNVTAPAGYKNLNHGDYIRDSFKGPGVTRVSLTWYKNGETYQEKLKIVVKTAAPYMKEDCVPADALEQPLLSDDIKVTYNKDSGLYHTAFRQGAIPTVAELTSTMRMPVPDGAVSYRYYFKQTNENPYISGDRTYLSALTNSALRPVSDPEGYTQPIANVDKVELQNKQLTMYFAASQDYNIRVVQWYSDTAGTQPMGNPVYVFGYNDSFVYDIRTDSVEKVDYEVTAPTLEWGTGLTLISTNYPQECSGNTLYIELRVSEEQDESFEGYIYLPYSYFGISGWDEISKVKENLPAPEIYHYLDANCDKYDGPLKGEYTEFGVKFKVTFFSPFTITCEPLRGDINGDGRVNGSDMQCLYEYLTTGSSTSPLSGKLLEAGLNVNKADGIDVYDLQRLYEFINGINSNW